MNEYNRDYAYPITIWHKTAERLEQVTESLPEDETLSVFCSCGSMKPKAQYLAVTTKGLRLYDRKMNCTYEAPFDAITHSKFSLERKAVYLWFGQEQIPLGVPVKEIPRLRRSLEMRGQPDPSVAPDDLTDPEEVAKQAVSAEHAELAETYGPKVEDAVFGGRRVRIYGKGFVRVNAPFRGKNANYQRLVAIEASSDVSKKTGLGRAVGAVATQGVNLLGSNKRGDVYLTITTDYETYVLHEDPPTAMNLRTVKRLEAAGNAARVRGAAAASERVTDTPGASASDPKPQVEPMNVSTHYPTAVKQMEEYIAELDAKGGSPTREELDNVKSLVEGVRAAKSASTDFSSQPPGTMTARLLDAKEALAAGLITEEEYGQLRLRILENRP